MLHVGFNQDSTCFACGTDTGFRIFSVEPVKETFSRDFSKALEKSKTTETDQSDNHNLITDVPMTGIGYVEMLFQCNILALVGGGKYPRFSPNKVMIWDDNLNRCIGELLFRKPVRAVKLRRDRVVVILEHKTYVYELATLKLIDQIETFLNPRGLCVLYPHVDKTILACPGTTAGHVRVELYHLHSSTSIAAHETTLACLALNKDGTRLATASEKGTLIRIFDILTAKPLQEVRRGAKIALIHSLCFDDLSEWLACSSDKGTIHIYKIQEEEKEALTVANPKSKWNWPAVKNWLPKYFHSEWSFAQYRIGDTSKTIVTFGPKHSIVIVSLEGNIYKATFDPEKPGTECQHSLRTNFLFPSVVESEKLQP